MLIDAGGTAFGDFDPGESIVAPFLRSRKILKVDYLVVSHPRIDHYGGMLAIVNEFSPAEFWSGAAQGRTGRFADLEDALERAQILRVALRAGEPCRLIEGVKFCVLYSSARKDDDGTVVVALEYLNLRYLFAGDIDRQDEEGALQQGELLRSAVLKVPRHGSTAASSPDFLDRVAPKLAIISAGARGRFESQRDEVSERYRAHGADVLRTDHDGAITIQSEGRELRYEGYKSGKRGVVKF
jgi:competence protein ComEC